jgi:hypothetical protein
MSSTDADADLSESATLSARTVMSMPWIFTQRHPLRLSGFASEAKRRGFALDAPVMRELYRHRLLIPLLSAQDRRVTEPAARIEEPIAGSSLLVDLRLAHEQGRLLDLATLPFKPYLPFERRPRYSRHWWNGLVYSWHQLHMLTDLHRILDSRRYKRHGQTRRVVLPTPHPLLVERAQRFRRLALAATALEARYMPKLDPEWTRLTNVDFEEWDRYREDFDPVTVSQMLGYPGDQARADAEELLSVAHRIDPLGRSWGKLARRAPRKKHKDLKDAALSAMDLRETAEVLLLFYEDLVSRAVAPPLPELPAMSWHPLRERLSERTGTLDQDLVDLGISPHPRVVLAVEGESEEVHVPEIWRELGYVAAPELMRILRLGGVDKDLQKVAALAATPLISGRTDDKHWDLLKPPTCLMVAVDPEGKFAPDKVENTRTAILDEIKSVLKAQGAETTDEELANLLYIRTWSECCYEFAHFDDDELADALIAIHDDINGLTREQLIDNLAKLRERSNKGHQRVDIKQVWSQWDYEPSKVKLARQLWPVLERKIQRCRVDEQASVPEIVEVVERAHAIAQQWRYSSFVITAAQTQANKSDSTAPAGHEPSPTP